MSSPKKIYKSAVLSAEKKKAIFSVFKTKKPKMKVQQNRDLKARLEMFIPKFTKSTEFLKENPIEARKLNMDSIDGCEKVVELNVELVDKPSFDQFLSKTENIVEKEIPFSVEKSPSVKPNIEVIESD